MGGSMSRISRMENKMRQVEATDERQYMIQEGYEVYEKQGSPMGAITFHYHNFYEIVYVLEGEYSSLVENQAYNLKKGDFLLVNQNVMHKYQFVEHKHDSSKRIILWITKEMLEQLGAGRMDLTSCFTTSESCAYHFPIYYEEMLRGYLLRLAMSETAEELEGAKEIMDRGHLTLFFGYLNSLCKRKEYIFANEELVTHPLVEKITQYCDAHISEKITVEDLAEYVHMSKYHFLRKFKEITGVTVHAYVTNKRLIKACECIREGIGIQEVYQECGFTDYSSFLRNFKAAFGVSPGKYKEYYPE